MRFMSLLYLWLPFAIAANSTNTSCNSCTNPASPEELAEIKIRLYTGSTIDDYTSVRVGDVLQLCSEIDNSKPSVIYVFGNRGRANASSAKAVISAYLSRGDHNTLLLDYNNISEKDITAVVLSAQGVARTLATVLNKLATSCLNASNLHIVGHSLGAHISGIAAEHTNFRIPKIIGLDPAGAGSEAAGTRLNPNLAKLVHVIHTDDGVYGARGLIGHADFYPNGGVSVQPGCANAGRGESEGQILFANLCSHYRACHYYAESVRNENSFIGVACDSYSNFRASLCRSNATAIMGYGTPNEARGRYYLQTNSKAPYGGGKPRTNCGESI